MRDVILGGLLLPLRLYLKPYLFREEVAALAPDLGWDYSLWQARHKLREPDFRCGIGRLALQSLIANLGGAVFACLALGLLSALGYEVYWARAALGVVGGVVAGVAFSIAFSVAVGVTAGMVVSIGPSLLEGLMLSSDNLPGAIIFGLMIGIAVDMIINSRKGEEILFPMFGITAGLLAGLISALMQGLEFGLATGTVLALGETRLIVYLPIQLPLGLVSWLLVRFSPELSPTLWRLSPVRWDEMIPAFFFPLPGLTSLLMALHHTDPALGQAALAEVAAHRYQSQAAYKALTQLAAEQARAVTSLPTLAVFERELDWLTEETPLRDADRTILLRMRDVSREAASARESDSATNRVRRLEAAAEMLQSLRKGPGEFGPVLGRWDKIVTENLDRARQRQREEEPIPQLYVSDGRPIRPAGRPETALPFKGRRSLFRQLEAALGGREGERATFLLYGQRRTGKTSALLQLPQRLGSRMIPAFLDMQSGKLGGAKDVAGLLGGLADSISDEARRHRGISLPGIDRKALSDDPYPALDHWLDRIEKTLAERTLLVCLDEFETLERGIQDGRLDTRILDTLRNVVQHRRQVAVLLSGSHQIDELPPHWASALITTTTLPISFLEEADARELIEAPVADFPQIYTSDAVDRIIRLTHCQPYLVQLVCALLVQRMNKARRMPPESFVEVDDVEAVIPLALERDTGYFANLWQTQTEGNLARRVLCAMASAPGEYLSREAMKELQADELTLSQAIRALLRREIIERADDGYRVTIPLVAEYVRGQILI